MNCRLPYILIIIFLVSIIQSSGQEKNVERAIDKPLRVEIQAKTDNETYQIIPAGMSGLVLFFKSAEIINTDNVKWYFSLYDRNLQQAWIKSIPLLLGMEFNKYSYNPDTISFLFRNEGKDKDAEFNIRVVRMILPEQKFIGNAGRIPENSEIVHFTVQGQKAFIGFNEKNRPAKIQIIDLVTGQALTFPLSQDLLSTLSGIRVDSTGYKVSAIIKKLSSKSRSEVYITGFDTLGNLVSEIQLSTINTERELKNVEIYNINSSSMMVLGTYGSVSSKKSSQKTRIPGESTGLFSSLIENGRQKYINFYNFLELKNANTLLGEKDILALKKRALKKNRGLSEYSLDLQILLHPVIFRNNQFLVLAESFYPQYHTESFTDFDFYGRPFTNSYTVFDGYRFGNGIIAAFNREGQLLWDNNMEIRNLLSLDLNPKVNVFFSGNETVLSYLSEGKIGSKIVRGNDVIEKLDFSALMLHENADKLLTETKSRMIYWYDNYFLCYGYQEIKNVAREGNNKRMVFYFSKIRFN